MRRKGLGSFDSRAGMIDGCGLFLRENCPSQGNPGKEVNAAEMRCRNVCRWLGRPGAGSWGCGVVQGS